jgi:hypothetical protein
MKLLALLLIMGLTITSAQAGQVCGAKADHKSGDRVPAYCR